MTIIYLVLFARQRGRLHTLPIFMMVSNTHETTSTAPQLSSVCCALDCSVV
eukprot:XP_001708295.1 Hypothetical protein GL50803_36364 [Giardia lamblia ATCC 50803]